MTSSNMEVVLHDGTTITVEISGEGPTILLPVNPVPVEGERAHEMRKWGVDPGLGRALIDGLYDHYSVVAFDYENHVIAHPKPETLTPQAIAHDFLAVADAAQANKFAYYGYSWLALSGLQLALRTDRLTALIMGGFPPIDGPYEAMLAVTRATYELATAPAAEMPAPNEAQDTDELDWDAADFTLSSDQTKQFLTLYGALTGFNDRAAQTQLTMPRLCFAGSNDLIVYSEKWGNVQVDIAGPLLNSHADLAQYGWETVVVANADHTRAMQSERVLPIIRPWLDRQNLRG